MTNIRTERLSLPNTLGLPASSPCGVIVRTPAQLESLVTLAQTQQEPLHVLGEGSNVVLPRTLSGIALLMRIKGVAITANTDEYQRIEVGAGESWQGFVRFCLGQGLGGGIENLTLIPGTVGAAPIQNIGAYGVEVAEFIEAIEVVDRRSAATDLARYWKPARECRFGYRDSCFKQESGRWIVSAVRFKLPYSRHATFRIEYAGIGEELARMGLPSLGNALCPAAIAEAVARTRRRKLPDPRRFPNAGSFFKNPLVEKSAYQELLAKAGPGVGFDRIPNWEQGDAVKLSAAALIDRAGWKQHPSECVAVWQRQPLVVVNRGGADAADVMRFAQAIQHSVNKTFGVQLEQEPQLLV